MKAILGVLLVRIWYDPVNAHPKTGGQALLAGTVLPGNDIVGNGVITPEEFPGM